MREVVLLRGINLGARNRIAMAELRELLSGAGSRDVRTYLQSGNVVLTSDAGADRLARDCERLLSERFGFEVPVVVRDRDQLAEVVRLNPLGDIATDPKRYQVSFLSAAPDADVVRQLAALATEPERIVAIGRELYAWHPDGIARSKLSAALASSRKLGVTATARNWTTVMKLLSLADEG